MKITLLTTICSIALYSYGGLYASTPVGEHEEDTSRVSLVVTTNIPDSDFLTRHKPTQLATMGFEEFSKIIQQEVRSTPQGKHFIDHIIKENTRSRLKYTRILHSLHQAIQNIDVKQFAEAIGEGKEDADPKAHLARSYLLQGIRHFQMGGEGSLEFGQIKLNK